MAQVVMALDFSAADNYKFDEQVNQWFINNNAIVNEESYTLGKDLLKYYLGTTFFATAPLSLSPTSYSTS